MEGVAGFEQGHSCQRWGLEGLSKDLQQLWQQSEGVFTQCLAIDGGCLAGGMAGVLDWNTLR